MTRFSGDYRGECGTCGEYVEFAVGVRPPADPVAMHFGPGGPTPVELEELQLAAMMDDSLDVRFRYRCPLCNEWSAGRTTCKSVGIL